MAGRKSSASNIKMPDVNALFGLEEDTGRLQAGGDIKKAQKENNFLKNEGSNNEE